MMEDSEQSIQMFNDNLTSRETSLVYLEWQKKMCYMTVIDVFRWFISVLNIQMRVWREKKYHEKCLFL